MSFIKKFLKRWKEDDDFFAEDDLWDEEYFWQEDRIKSDEDDEEYEEPRISKKKEKWVLRMPSGIGILLQMIGHI